MEGTGNSNPRPSLGKVVFSSWGPHLSLAVLFCPPSFHPVQWVRPCSRAPLIARRLIQVSRNGLCESGRRGRRAGGSNGIPIGRTRILCCSARPAIIRQDTYTIKAPTQVTIAGVGPG